MTTGHGNKTLLPRASRIQSLQQQNLHDQEIKQKERISQQLKEKYIQDLEERNRRIKNEIQKITEILEENEEKELEKIKQREKNMGKNYKSNVGRSAQDNNPELLKKELENVYKQIKNYERQIQKTENYRVGSKNSSDEIARLQSIRHQKLQHLQKLNTELSTLSSTQVMNSKKLKNNMGRQFYQNQILKVGDQLKVMREKLRALEEKEKKKVVNAKKQLEFIKKLQNELLEEGVAMDEIQELKRKNIYVQIKTAMMNNKEKDSAQKSNSPEQDINGQAHYQTEEEPITYEKLEQMKSEIKLYKKLHQDYEKRLISIHKQKELADKQTSEKKKILQQKNVQIEKLNQEIEEVKQLVRKNNAVTNATIVGQPDSIRKLQRKKSIDASIQSKSKDKDQKKSSNSPNKATLQRRSKP